MQRANGRQKQNSYRFKPRVRDAPTTSSSADDCVPSGSGGSRNKEQSSLSNNGGITSAKRLPLSVALDAVKSERKSNSQVGDVRLPFQLHASPGSSQRLYSKDSTNQSTNHLNPDRRPESQKSSSIDHAPIQRDCKDGNTLSSNVTDGWQIQRLRTVKSSIPLTERRLPDSNILRSQTRDGTKTAICNDSMTPNAGSPPLGQVIGPNKNKKKKENHLTKSEKQKKREDDALKEMYKPKDSRVTLLTSDIFEKIKSCAPPLSAGAFQFSPTTVPSRSSICDFPTLHASTSSSIESPQFKSFAAALSTPIPISPLSTSLKLDIGCSRLGPASSVTQLLTPEQLESPSTTISVKKPKLSKRAITVNIIDMLQITKSKRNAVANKQITRKSKHDRFCALRENPKFTIGNLLDSSGPVVIHRGKIKQKKKTPSKLKKSILQNREIRKNIKPFGNSDLAMTESSSQHDQSVVLPVDTLLVPSLDEVDAVSKSNCDTRKSDTNLTILDSISELGPCLPFPSAILPPEELKNPVGSKDGNGNESNNLFKSLLEQAEQSSNSPPPVPPSAIQLVKLQMHSRKFRDYCDMFVTKELHGLVIPLMQELHRLQDRIYKTDPIKLQTKRRFVNGIKEVLNAVKLRKVQLIILAPDIEPHRGEGGLDDKTSEILSLATEKKIPYIFSGSRFILGRCIKQTKSPVSALAILDKQSVEDQFNNLLEAAQVLREQYSVEFNRRVQEVMMDRFTKALVIIK